MMNNLVVSLIAASVSAWTVDLRNNLEDSHTIYLKAGETLDVLVDGQYSTGFRWINNIAFAKTKENVKTGHVDFVE